MHLVSGVTVVDRTGSRMPASTPHEVPGGGGELAICFPFCQQVPQRKAMSPRKAPGSQCNQKCLTNKSFALNYCYFYYMVKLDLLQTINNSEKEDMPEDT